MENRAARTVGGIILVLAGIAVLAIFSWNIFAFNLPEWANIPAMIIGILLPIWGLMFIINTYRVKK